MSVTVFSRVVTGFVDTVTAISRVVTGHLLGCHGLSRILLKLSRECNGNVTEMSQLFLETSRVHEMYCTNVIYINAVYKNEIHEEEMPRNLKQIQNLRYKGNNEMRISRDALFNIHAIARNSSNEFIHSIHTFPNLVVICGHSLVLDELEKLLYFDTIEQCLSYDTTFQLGDFYVSALILLQRPPP